MQKQRIFIFAPSIYLGGSWHLLKEMIEEFENCQMWRSVDLAAVLDRRIEKNSVNLSHFSYIQEAESGIWGRLRAEYYLLREVGPGDLVLCFGDLPPLFKLSGRVVTYVHNTLISGVDRGVGLDWGTFLKYMIQRQLFSLKKNNSDLFWVQTDTVRDRIVRVFRIEMDRVQLAPFYFRTRRKISKPNTLNPKWDFGYVSLPWRYKNHRQLIEAFVMLAKEGHTPSLVVTVPREMDSELADLIEKVTVEHGVRISNLGYVEHENIGQIYGSIKALIFPSSTETVGLPILEAWQYGLPILVSEKDFARDVVVPTETFDPDSPRSIKRAVLRFLKKDQKPKFPSDAREFVDKLKQIAMIRSDV